MVVYNFNNLNIHFPLNQQRLKYQSVWMIQITAPLTFSIARQFMKPTGKGLHIIQGINQVQCIQSLEKQLCSSVTHVLCAQFEISRKLLKFFVFKSNIHDKDINF